MKRTSLRRPSNTDQRTQPPQKPKWSADELLKLAQVVAIVAAGAWTLNQYFSFEKERSRVSLEQQMLEKTLKAAEVRGTIEGRIATKFEFSVKCKNGSDMYTAAFSYRFENISKADVNISWTMLHRFIGLVKPIEKEGAHQINRPPIPYLKLDSSGPVTWKNVGYTAGVLNGDWLVQDKLLSTGFVFQPGTGGTKPLRPGDSSINIAELLVKAQPGSYFGIVFDYGLDGNTSGSSVYHHFDFTELPSCKTNSKSATNL